MRRWITALSPCRLSGKFFHTNTFLSKSCHLSFYRSVFFAAGAHLTTPSDPSLSPSSCIYPLNVMPHLTAILSFTLLIVFEYTLSTSLLSFPFQSTIIPLRPFHFVYLSVTSYFSGQKSNRGIKQTALPHPFSYPPFTLSPSLCYATPSVIHWQQPLIPKNLPSPHSSLCFFSSSFS